jgi:hypothetical protein
MIFKKVLFQKVGIFDFCLYIQALLGKSLVAFDQVNQFIAIYKFPFFYPVRNAPACPVRYQIANRVKKHGVNGPCEILLTGFT